MERKEVNTAFEILLEEIEAVANSLNEAGAEALRAGEYERVKPAIEDATRIAEFREKVRTLKKDWAELLRPRPRVRKSKGRNSKARLPRGLRTSEDFFRSPILIALVELGGRAPIGDVLALVEKEMQGILNEHDYQPLPSDAGSLRWRNTAQWCRNTLVQEGLMKSDSQRGIWEISDAGRRWLHDEISQS